MLRSRVLLSIFLILLEGSVMSVAASSAAETWIAQVSDQACGANYSGPGHAECVRKCARGGAGIGHPEWKPQPLVLVKEVDRSVWDVDNSSTLRGLEGQGVRVEVVVNATKKVVHINKVTQKQ
jgi:hypothetical protein